MRHHHTTRHHYPRLLCILTIAFLMALAATMPVPAGGNAEVMILHTNDFHGQLLPMEDRNLAEPPGTVSGAAYLATRIKEIRSRYKNRFLLLDAGDIAQGTPISNLNQGLPVVRYMNYMGYDAMSPGNHEFDWGFGGFRNMIREARFPVLCANLVEEKSGQVPSFLKPYAVFEKDGIKIGIIGVITPTMPRMTNPKNIAGYRFLDPEEPVRNSIKELQAQGIKVIGLLSHLGFKQDKALAARVEGLTFIVGGHSHTAVQTTERVNNTVIVQTGASGRYLGNLLLTLNRDNGALISYTAEHELIPIIDSAITPDPEVEKLLAPYYEKVKPIMNRVIGHLSADMLNVAPEGYGDTPLGNFVTDAVRATFGVDMVIYNTEGIRAPLYKGEISGNDTFALLPFDNEIVTIELTGEQVLKTIEFFIQNFRYIQVSGVTLTYYPGREKGKRLEHVMIGGKPLDPAKTYSLATVDFLYYTTGDFDVLRSGKNLRYGEVARTVIEKHIRKLKNITPPDDRRITVIKEEKK